MLKLCRPKGGIAVSTGSAPTARLYGHCEGRHADRQAKCAQAKVCTAIAGRFGYQHKQARRQPGGTRPSTNSTVRALAQEGTPTAKRHVRQHRQAHRRQAVITCARTSKHADRKAARAWAQASTPTASRYVILFHIASISTGSDAHAPGERRRGPSQTAIRTGDPSNRGGWDLGRPSESYPHRHHERLRCKPRGRLPATLRYLLYVQASTQTNNWYVPSPKRTCRLASVRQTNRSTHASRHVNLH